MRSWRCTCGEEMFAEFEDEDDIEDVEDESVEQEGPLGEGLV